MIRALPCVLALVGCAGAPLVCPDVLVSAFVCPSPMHDFYDPAFRDELNSELMLAPEDLALARAARAFLSQAMKCERTF